MAKILITGIAGSMAQLTARRLVDDGHEVVGVDYREVRDQLPPSVQVYRANYNKTRIEDVVRRHQPSHVLHLGRVGNLKTESNKRFDLNVVGSAKIMELCLKHGVERLVVLSTFHIYGAHPHNHIPINEDEPLRAAQTFPQLADAVQLDNQATTWVYRHRTLRTVVLRPTNIVGPHIKNAISTYLRQPNLFYLIGFNPMWQFVHELDMIEALLLALWGKDVGVFNVAGAAEIPVVDAFELTGARRIPIPGPLADLTLRLGSRFGASFPPYLLDFLKYPCVITDAKFRDTFGFASQIGVAQTIRSAVRR